MEGKRDVKCPVLLFVFSMLRFVVHRNSICFVFFSSQVDSFICLEKKKKHLGSSAHASLPRRRCPPGRRYVGPSDRRPRRLNCRAPLRPAGQARHGSRTSKNRERPQNVAGLLRSATKKKVQSLKVKFLHIESLPPGRCSETSPPPPRRSFSSPPSSRGPPGGRRPADRPVLVEGPGNPSPPSDDVFC